MFTVAHVVTADSATGEPWPPSSDGSHYCAVRSIDGFTKWRRILLPDDTITVTASNKEGDMTKATKLGVRTARSRNFKPVAFELGLQRRGNVSRSVDR